jgi:hypothetical protein
MTDHPISTDVLSLQASVLDHSSEFVEHVYHEAPTEYQRLMASERFRRELEQDNAFNHGKLFTYAELVVFRREFQKRFPGASTAACTNAFCRLLLKNDISITNLVDFVEGPDDRGALLLNQPAG